MGSTYTRTLSRKKSKSSVYSLDTKRPELYCKSIDIWNGLIIMSVSHFCSLHVIVNSSAGNWTMHTTRYITTIHVEYFSIFVKMVTIFRLSTRFFATIFSTSQKRQFQPLGFIIFKHQLWCIFSWESNVQFLLCDITMRRFSTLQKPMTLCCPLMTNFKRDW